MRCPVDRPAVALFHPQGDVQHGVGGFGGQGVKGRKAGFKGQVNKGGRRGGLVWHFGNLCARRGQDHPRLHHRIFHLRQDGKGPAFGRDLHQQVHPLTLG